MSITRYKFQILLSLLIFLAASSCRPAESQKEPDSYSDPGEQTPSPTLPKSSLTQELEDESSELYRDESMGFTVRLPSIWEQEKSQSGMVNFSGDDGFVRIKTLSSGGMTLEEITLAEAYHELSPFGTEPQVDLIPLQGRITYRILPSENQPKVNTGDPAWGMVLIPLPRPIQVDNSIADILILHADISHLDSIASSFLLTETILDETRFPAASETPAAGICGQVEGDIVEVNIGADMMPTPRCLQLRGDQLLSLVNQTGEQMPVSLAWYRFSLEPGQGLLLNIPLGDYLAPGVHDIVIDGGGSAPELWVLESN